MAVTVLYFGELREQIDRHKEQIEADTSDMTVELLLKKLSARGEPWSGALGGSQPLRVAINQEMVQHDAIVPDNAEVAFFRPVTGG